MRYAMGIAVVSGMIGVHENRSEVVSETGTFLK
jgi:hypothetical protein